MFDQKEALMNSKTKEDVIKEVETESISEAQKYQ